jgi:hypothetical protein
MRTRRLLLLAALTLAPLAGACVASPTSPDDPTPPIATDTTGRREQNPWH